MGSGVSALPERISEEELRRICGSRFRADQYEALKGEDGLVPRDSFLLAVNEGQEKELFDLYMSFCPDGYMDSRTFIKFCKDTKLLNKKKFAHADGDILFQKIKSKSLTASTTINFQVFRFDLVPEIAQKLGIELSALIFKLSRADGPTLNSVTQTVPVRLHDDTNTYTGARAVLRNSVTLPVSAPESSGTASETNTPSVDGRSPPDFIALHRGGSLSSAAISISIPISSAEATAALLASDTVAVGAAIKLQKIQRGHLARQESFQLREVKFQPTH